MSADRSVKNEQVLAAKGELLRKQPMGMLTTIRRDGLLSTNPVSFVWDGARLRVSTLKSRLKYRNLQSDARVTLCVQSFANPMDYVEIRGRATLEDDPDRAFLREQFRVGSGGQDPPDDLDPPGAERAIIEIHPEQVSAPQIYGGRFDR